jgi:hypothetical protein
MTALRLGAYSRQARVNVDVFLGGDTNPAPWLRRTPDTYRVRTSPLSGEAPPWSAGETTASAVGAALPDIVVVPGDVSAIAGNQLAGLLSEPATTAAVLAGVSWPRRIGKQRPEPLLTPDAVAVYRTAWEEVGGLPSGPHPLPGLVARLRAGGHRLALIPSPGAAEEAARQDPIEGRGSIVILAAVPMHDVGGGSRAAQLALELIGRGYHVAHVSLFGAQESVDLGLRFVHPRLEQYRLDQFDPQVFVSRLGSEARVLVVELPARPVLEVLQRLASSGYQVVYDLVDDWTARSLGAGWYRPSIERRIAGRADLLVASAGSLAGRLEEITGRSVVLVPNAVDGRLFSGDPGRLPGDFPAGDGPVFGYHGSLYGDWFDWDGLTRLARHRPEARLVIIGDDTTTRPEMPGNVFFLGLKARHQLPGYVGRFDVGLVPFIVSEVTHAVSPLKVFEYLAMGVPVAAPPLRSLAGLEGVFAASDLVEAVETAGRGPRPDSRRVRERHSWGNRLAVVFEALGWELGSDLDPPPQLFLRPPVHYGRSERLVP